MSFLSSETMIPLVVGFFKSPVPAMSGLVLGASMAEVDPVVAVLVLLGAACLWIVRSFLNAVAKVIAEWLGKGGQKIWDAPTKAERDEERRALTKVLEDFARAAEEERKEVSKFREATIRLLADHGARIEGLEAWRDRHSGEHSRS